MPMDMSGLWAVGLAVIAGTLAGCGGGTTEDADEGASGADVMPAPGGGSGRASADNGTGSAPRAKAEGPGFERLRQALAGAPVAGFLTRADRLESLRAWLEENHPELSPREREARAQLLALFGEILESEGMTIAKGQGIGELQMVMLWGADADGDGLLSDAEIDRFIAENQQLSMLETPEMLARFDADGDGSLSTEEVVEIQKAASLSMEPIIDGMIERITLRRWDDNGDGAISDVERAAHASSVNVVDLNNDGTIDFNERLAGHASLVGDMLQRMMSLLPQPQFDASKVAGPMPNYADYDADGDGAYSETESAAYQQALGEYQQAFTERMPEIQRQLIREQFDIAVRALDGDGDSRLADGEWEDGYESLRVERDRSVFMDFYDVNSDGSIGDAEVAAFMNLFETRSIAADANFDGTIDTGDLQQFLRQCQQP